MSTKVVYPDPRFFPSPEGPFTLEKLAIITRTKIHRGNAALKIKNILTLEKAGVEDISFFFRPSPEYLAALSTTKAAAVIVPSRQIDKVPATTAVLVSDNPHLSMTLAMRAFFPEANLLKHLGLDKPFKKSIKPLRSVKVGRNVVIGKGVEIGENTWIGPNTVIYPNVKIGKNVRIGSNCTLSYCYIGDGVVIGHSSVVGNQGFGFSFDSTIPDHLDIPHMGVVKIGANAHLGDGVCIARGSNQDTLIANSVRLDNMVQVGHNSTIGPMTAVAGQVGIAGSTHIGAGVQVGGQAGFSGHQKIGDRALIGAQSGVVSDVPSGVTMMGTPAVLQDDYHRLIKAQRSVLRKKPDSGQK